MTLWEERNFSSYGRKIPGLHFSGSSNKSAYHRRNRELSLKICNFLHFNSRIACEWLIIKYLQNGEWVWIWLQTPTIFYFNSFIHNGFCIKTPKKLGCFFVLNSLFAILPESWTTWQGVKRCCIKTKKGPFYEEVLWQQIQKSSGVGSVAGGFDRSGNRR